ncbi:hypothetical protein [Streptomyces atratus]|uniref:hypothetical protein n=1 Tax=Streptomyces atratus TaxID=1893 RepID=UPI00340AF49A
MNGSHLLIGQALGVAVEVLPVTPEEHRDELVRFLPAAHADAVLSYSGAERRAPGKDP